MAYVFPRGTPVVATCTPGPVVPTRQPLNTPTPIPATATPQPTVTPPPPLTPVPTGTPVAPGPTSSPTPGVPYSPTPTPTSTDTSGCGRNAAGQWVAGVWLEFTRSGTTAPECLLLSPAHKFSVHTVYPAGS